MELKKKTLIFQHLSTLSNVVQPKTPNKQTQTKMKFCVNFNEIFNLRISKLCAKGPQRPSRYKTAVRFDSKSRGTQNFPGRAAACLWCENPLTHSFYINKHKKELWRETLR